MDFCLYEALFSLFLILYMGWVFRDRGVGWLPFTCVFRPPSGSLLRACFQDQSITTEIAIDCFEIFSQTITKKTVVIIDNAPIHTSQALRKKLPAWKKKGLVLKFLPAYCPELNLIEILWRFIKYRWLLFAAYLSVDTLGAAVEEILVKVGSKYTIEFQ